MSSLELTMADCKLARQAKQDKQSGGGCCSLPSNVPDAVAEQFPGGMGWWDMPRPQQRLPALRGALKSFPWREGAPQLSGCVFSQAPAAEAAKFMYEATKVDGVWDLLPEKIRGVYWMRGNGVSEELTSLQYGVYYPDRRLLLVPFAPATWGWPAGTPANAPYGGNIYGGDLTYLSAETLLGDAGATKDPATRSAKDWLCFSYAWRDSSLEDASLGAQFGPLDQHGGMQVAGCITGKFGLHQLPGEQPGALWNRSCKWGVGRAACLEFGSYTLTKVIDAAGAPLEPNHSEFVDYMGDVPIFCWTGFEDEGGE